jgi:hypothetical protein
MEKQSLSYWVGKLTEAVIIGSKNSYFPFEDLEAGDHHTKRLALHDIQLACQEILEQTGARKFEYSEVTRRMVDISEFNEEQLVNFRAANDERRSYIKDIEEFRAKAQAAERELNDFKSKSHWETLQTMRKVYSAVQKFDNDYPILNISDKLMEYIDREVGK